MPVLEQILFVVDSYLTSEEEHKKQVSQIFGDGPILELGDSNVLF